MNAEFQGAVAAQAYEQGKAEGREENERLLAALDVAREQVSKMLDEVWTLRSDFNDACAHPGSLNAKWKAFVLDRSEAVMAEVTQWLKRGAGK